MIEIKKLIENLVRKKRNKYIERTKTVTESMEELIEKIRVCFVGQVEKFDCCPLVMKKETSLLLKLNQT